MAVEGKGPTDPLDRPYKSRKMSAVDQGYRYAINLPCDWIIVTSMRETRLYYKGADQFTFERFDIADLVDNPRLRKKFIYLLGAERVLAKSGTCHLDELRTASDKVGRDLTKDYYLKYANIREDVFEQLCAENPEESRPAVLTATQKLLDRVLFCAFCEDRGLLPDDTLKQAFEHADPYHPRPIWENFRGLFHAIDKGNESLKIPAYNGGLFAADDILDRLTVPDAICGHFKNLGEYEYRQASDFADAEENSNGTIIDVDILGHIFEQSISDLEHIRNELAGLVPAVGKEKHKTRRKKDGAFYTPAFITRYIVEQALGGVLKDRFEQLRSQHQQRAKDTARKVLDDPNVYDVDALNNPQKKALTTFWESNKGSGLIVSSCRRPCVEGVGFESHFQPQGTQSSQGRSTEAVPFLPANWFLTRRRKGAKKRTGANVRRLKRWPADTNPASSNTGLCDFSLCPRCSLW